MSITIKMNVWLTYDDVSVEAMESDWPRYQVERAIVAALAVNPSTPLPFFPDEIEVDAEDWDPS